MAITIDGPVQPRFGEDEEKTMEIKIKRGRGRPKKEADVDSAAKRKIATKIVAEGIEEAKDRSLKGERRGRGRSKKQSTQFSSAIESETAKAPDQQEMNDMIGHKKEEKDSREAR